MRVHGELQPELIDWKDARTAIPALIDAAEEVNGGKAEHYSYPEHGRGRPGGFWSYADIDDMQRKIAVFRRVNGWDRPDVS